MGRRNSPAWVRRVKIKACLELPAQHAPTPELGTFRAELIPPPSLHPCYMHVIVSIDCIPLFSDGTYSWMWSGPVLNVLACRPRSAKNPEREELVASYNFGTGIDDSMSFIVTVLEYGNRSHQQPNDGLRLLLLVQVPSSTLLCLFDARSSRVIRTIKLSAKVRFHFLRVFRCQFHVFVAT